MQESRKIAVVGSGIGGIAAAVRMSLKGFRVDVFEKNKIPGGKFNQIHQDAFRFDTGPSLFTLPHLIEELFEIAGKNTGDHFRYRPLNNLCKYHFSDATTINAWSDPDAFAEEVFEKCGEDPRALRNYLAEAEKLYNLSSGVFLFSAFHKVSHLFRQENAQTALNLHKLDAFKTLHKRNASRFQSPQLIQLFDRYATYNGSSPFKAPATMKVISHLEHNSGGFFPEKGMYDIIQQLYDLALELGVKFHFESPVDQILIKNGKVNGLKCHGENICYDLIISDVDVFSLYEKLLPDHKLKRRIRRAELSSSAMIFYWGIQPELPDMELHNILFSGDYEEEFKMIFDRKEIFHDPTVYIFISKKVVPDDAPDGAANCFVMINTPGDFGQNWDEMLANARKHIIAKINRSLGIKIQDRIIFEKVATPQSIARNTSSYRGALYGPSSNSMMAAFNRHANFSNRIKGIYFCGGSVHPGGGIPLCLSSAKIVSELIK